MVSVSFTEGTESCDDQNDTRNECGNQASCCEFDLALFFDQVNTRCSEFLDLFFVKVYPSDNRCKFQQDEQEQHKTWKRWKLNWRAVSTHRLPIWDTLRKSHNFLLLNYSTALKLWSCQVMKYLIGESRNLNSRTANFTINQENINTSRDLNLAPT